MSKFHDKYVYIKHQKKVHAGGRNIGPMVRDHAINLIYDK